MKKNLTTIFGALLALALLASACGGGDAGDEELIAAVSAQMTEGDDVPAGVDVDCMSAAMVNGLGGAEVMEEEYGLTAETIAAGQEPDEVELSVDDARSMADEMLECGLDQVMIDGIVDEGLPEEAASCLLDNIDSDAMRDMFATEFMSSADADRIGEAAEDALGEGLFGAIGECDIALEDIGF